MFLFIFTANIKIIADEATLINSLLEVMKMQMDYLFPTFDKANFDSLKMIVLHNGKYFFYSFEKNILNVERKCSR